MKYWNKFLLIVFLFISLWLSRTAVSNAACVWIIYRSPSCEADPRCLGTYRLDCNPPPAVDNPPVCNSITPLGKIGCTNYPTGIDLGNPIITTQDHPQCGTKDEAQSLPGCPAEGCRVGCYLGGGQGNDPFVSANEAFQVAYPNASSVRLTVSPKVGSFVAQLPACPGGCPVNCTNLYNYPLCGGGGCGCDDAPPDGYGCRKCSPNVGDVISNQCRGGSCDLPNGQSEGNYTPPAKRLTYNIPTFTGSSIAPQYLLFDVINNNMGSTGTGYVCAQGGCTTIGAGVNQSNLTVPLLSTDTTFSVTILYYTTSPENTGFTVTNIRPAWTPNSAVACPLSNQLLPVVVNATDDKGFSSRADQYGAIDFTYSSTVAADKTSPSWVLGNPPGIKVLTYAPSPGTNTTLYGQVSDNSNSYPANTTSCPAAAIACIQTPQKSCTVSVKSPNSIVTQDLTVSPKQNITVTYSGYSQNADTIRIWLEKKNGTVQAAPKIGTETFSSPYYYYRLDPSDCTSSGGVNCPAKTLTINTAALPLPLGEYYLHCDVATPNPPDPPYEICSGNPFCTYEGIAGVSTLPCTNWQSCSAADYSHLNVVTPPVTTLTGQAYDDLNSNGCWDTGEPTLTGNLPGKTFTINDGYTGPKTVTFGATGNYSTTINQGYTSSIDASSSLPAGYPRLTAYPNATAINCSAPPVGYENSSNFTPLTATYTKNIGFTKNVPWLTAYDGDIYAAGGYTISVPPPPTGTNYLINSLFGTNVAGGVGMSGAGIITNQGGTNRTSLNGTLPGWQVTNYAGPTLSNKLNFSYPGAPTVPGWASLAPNGVYTLSGSAINAATYNFSPSATNMVATVYVNGPLSITGDFVNGATVNNNKGVVLIVSGPVTIASNVSRIDAVIISNSTITTLGTTLSPLIINGGLYAVGNYSASSGLDLQSRDIGNNSTPAVIVNFKPVYLLTATSSLFKSTSVNWKEVSPQ